MALSEGAPGGCCPPGTVYQVNQQQGAWFCMPVGGSYCSSGEVCVDGQTCLNGTCPASGNGWACDAQGTPFCQSATCCSNQCQPGPSCG